MYSKTYHSRTLHFPLAAFHGWQGSSLFVSTDRWVSSFFVTVNKWIKRARVILGGCDFEREVTSCDTTLTVRSHLLSVNISNKFQKWIGGGWGGRLGIGGRRPSLPDVTWKSSLLKSSWTSNLLIKCLFISILILEKVCNCIVFLKAIIIKILGGGFQRKNSLMFRTFKKGKGGEGVLVLRAQVWRKVVIRASILRLKGWDVCIVKVDWC